MSENTLHCDVVVIGAGVAGLSTALQLADRGQRVVLLDKGEFGSGATGQASGLLGQLRSTVGATRMLVDSIRILHELEERAGTSLFTMSGSVRIATTSERAEELRQAVAVGKEAGLEVTLIEPGELAERVPGIRTEDVLAAAYCPTDGYLNPPELARMYADLCRSAGVDMRPNTKVRLVYNSCGRANGVLAGETVFMAPVVVNAAGPWSHLVAELGDQTLPTAGVGHCYFTFTPDPAIDPQSASLRDRGLRLYSRPTREGELHVGIYETKPTLYDMAKLPRDFQMAELRTPEGHPTVRTLWEAARRRFSFLSEDTPRRLTTGIMSWTPDGQPLIGKLPDVHDMYHCAGFCGHGVMQSAAIGVLMAELITENKCRYDLGEIEADRFYDFPEFWDRAHINAACLNAYATCYGPLEEDPTRA